MNGEGVRGKGSIINTSLYFLVLLHPFHRFSKSFFIVIISMVIFLFLIFF